MLRQCDLAVINLLRHLCCGGWIVDYSIYSLSDNNLLKGGVFLASLWWFWGHRCARQARSRGVVVSIAVAGLLSIALSVALKSSFHFRPRPYLALPDGTFPFDLGMADSSSFPSDHAALFFALSTGLLYLSRPAGFLALGYTIHVIATPRVCLGLHYPSDILAGALVGAGSAWLVNGTSIRRAISRSVAGWLEKHPSSFYACSFLLSFQLATLFDDSRALAAWASSLARLFRR